jgi:hypothetical protein
MESTYECKYEIIFVIQCSKFVNLHQKLRHAYLVGRKGKNMNLRISQLSIINEGLISNVN